MGVAKWNLGAAVGGAVTWPVVAQPTIWQGQVLQGLHRVDEGVADVGPLSVSQRVAPVDLREPTGFQGVYEFQRAVPFGKPETMYARSSGGLTAIFPRSVYVESRGGLVPEIPAGTVFMIGAPGEIRAARRGSSSPLAVDMSVAGQAAAAAQLAPPVSRAVAPAEPATIWSNERLRQQRIGRLLESLIEPRR